MALRICLVTPFAWSRPHEVNEHVAGIAQELRVLGHAVTIVTSSNRAADLATSRLALVNGSLAESELVVIGPAVPISRRSRMGVPLGVRTNLSRALRTGRFDVVHGFEPGLPSLSYLALRDSQALTVASFFSPERLTYPPSRAQRARLLGRTDALIASSPEVAAAAGDRFPGDYLLVSPGVAGPRPSNASDDSVFTSSDRRCGSNFGASTADASKGKDSAIALLKTADTYLQFNLMNKYDPSQENSIRLFDEENNNCQFTVDFIKKQEFKGTQVVTTYNQVKSIYIKGPKERMEKFLNEYLLPAVNSCITSKDDKLVFFGKTQMTIQSTPLVESIKMDYKEM